MPKPAFLGRWSPTPNYGPEGPALFSAPDNPICWVRQAAPMPYPLLISGPATLGSPPHCCAHRTDPGPHLGH